MIEYYENLIPEEQEEVSTAVQLLYRQTFVLERKYDRRTGRMQFNKDFRVCSKHLTFLRSYFSISGISVLENSRTGIIYLQGETVIGEKLPRLTTLYVLILKLIYDEQMAAPPPASMCLRLWRISMSGWAASDFSRGSPRPRK